MAMDVDECKTCHADSYDKWKGSDHSQKIECQNCHMLAEDNFAKHITNPSLFTPTINYSAESCGNCHTGIFDEWNEYNMGYFNYETMASHSEPVIELEPHLLTSEKSCISCKSTNGAIFNLMEAEIYNLNEEEVPKPEDVQEWRITCVACHEPHTTLLRVEDSTQLCSNCHNSQGAVPDGYTTVARHTQWEMYSNSSYASDTHPGNIGCVDCHVVTIPENKSIMQVETFGHSFTPDIELLSSSESSNGCYECHGESLPSLSGAKQGVISSRLGNLERLQIESINALESINGTNEYDIQRKNYNNALFYISSVQNDGSLGIHNGERARNELDIAGEMFNEIIAANNSEDKKSPGFGFFITISVLLVLACCHRN
jgi:predicted CXXCH cytochrome family protein